MPQEVIQQIKSGQSTEAQEYESVTIFFSDIANFTVLSSKTSTKDMLSTLNKLWIEYDAIARKWGLYKVETIGDAYVGVCNLVKKQEADHAKRIAEFAMDTLKAASDTQILPEDGSMGTVRIRVGIHCGPIVARVVGSRNPRYCVFV